MTDCPTPIFLFSMPRSGSTLTQRILGAEPSIATASEPHLLLPYLYALRDRGIYAEYEQLQVKGAIDDFCALLPRKMDDYFAEVARLVSRLYALASPPGTKYFLDKTPRYHLIADEIFRMFPDAKFIFLWRNPLAIVASLMEMQQGKWNLYRSKIDLYEGLQNLVDVYQSKRESVCAVRYEDLIAQPEASARKMFQYLGLPFNSGALSGFSGVALKGRFGDKAGEKYQVISTQPLEKWKATLSSHLRIAWCRRYLNWIGRERLAVMGYDLNTLLEDLQAIPATYSRIGSDAVRASLGVVYCAFEPRIASHKAKLLTSWHRVHAHL
jgi:Sulfotransferase family